MLVSTLAAYAACLVLMLCLVEVAPIYDNAGETTALAAAEVVHSLIALMVQTPVEGKR